MASSYVPVPPSGRDITGVQPGTPSPDGQGATQACPLCTGSGEIPADMARDDMVNTVDTNLTTTAPPVESDMAPVSEFDPDQQAEIDRLSGMARSRMQGPRGFSTP